MTTYIKAPDYNDSLSRVVLDGKEYLIRFTYNATGDYWTFGLYEIDETPLVLGVKIVPNFPLTYFYSKKTLPNGVFGCLTNKAHIGRESFIKNEAVFVFVPMEDLKEGE